MEDNQADKSEENSLENVDGVEAEVQAPQNPEENGGAKKKLKGGLKGIISRLNVYLLLFILIVVMAVFVVFVGLQRSKKELSQPTIKTTPLTQETLDKLNGSDATVGDAKQTLSIESNAIFTNSVLIKGSLDVAGTIKVGGPLTVPGLSVTGSTTLDQLSANKMSISGDGSIQGTLNVQKNLTVGGSGQFGGPLSAPQITAKSLVIEGDLGISRHIDAGGGTPGLSNGTARGGGGQASVSGKETAGTVTINTGSGPGVGCFATVSFSASFSQTPHIAITPVGSAAAGINYYINRSTSTFSICTTNSAPGNANFSFDYIAID